MLLTGSAAFALLTDETRTTKSYNKFTMDVVLMEDGSYSLQPMSRRLSSIAADPLCEPVSECEVCTTGQRDKEPLCQDTGRVQRFHCKSLDDGSAKDEFKICKRTVADEEFLMMRMQVLFFLFGSLSLLAVRKLRGTTATLFDQRKAKRNNQNYNQDNEVEIEFSPMMGQGNNDEWQRLVPIDVV